MHEEYELFTLPHIEETSSEPQLRRDIPKGLGVRKIIKYKLLVIVC